MKNIAKAVLIAAVVGAPLVAGASEEGEVKYRKAIMKGIAGHAGAIAEIAKGNVGHTGHLQGHAHALVELSQLVPSAFKNNAMGFKTTAKEEVWSDWAGFDSKAGDLERASLAVVEAAKSGPGAVKGKLGDLFDTCKACHKEYRVKKK